MLKFKENPSGQFIKRTTLNHISSVFSGEIYYGEYLFEESKLTATNHFYQASVPTLNLHYWSTLTNCWQRSSLPEDTLCRFNFYTTLNLLTNEESSNAFLDMATQREPAYTVSLIQKVLRACRNHYLEEGIANLLGLSNASQITKESFESVLRTNLSKELAEQLIADAQTLANS